MIKNDFFQKNRMKIPLVLLLIISIIGELLGEFAWFGGNTAIKDGVAWLSIFMGLLGGFILSEFKLWSVPKFLLYVIISQVVFIVSIALGQVLYFEPNSLSEFNRLYVLAIQGRL